MSNSGMYKILANDGKQDALLCAADKLKQHIEWLKAQGRKQGIADPIPQLQDIEKSHIIFFNSVFKPFVPVGTEYHKARANAGNPSFGSEITFSIPLMGDLFLDMVMGIKLSEATATDGTVPDFPAPPGLADIVKGAESQISADEDTVNGVYTVYKQEYIDYTGKVVPVGSTARNFVAYCDLPGIRLLERVKFTVNGNTLDEYTYNAPTMRYKAMLPPNKRASYERLIGQEVEEYGVSQLSDVLDVSKYPEDVREKLGLKVGQQTSRRKYSYLSGPQTPKLVQPRLELLVPLQFWFCRDPSLAIPSVAIPFGQRFIEIRTCRQSDLIGPAPGGLYLRTTVKKLYSSGTDQGTSAAVAVEKVETWEDIKPVLVPNSNVSENYKIEDMSLIINNLFTTSEVHDIYIKRVTFNLARVHREQVIATNSDSGRQQLSSLKFPIEYFLLGARPKENTSQSNPNRLRLWHEHTKIEEFVSEVSTNLNTEVVVDQTTPYDTLDGTGLKHVSAHLVSDRIVCKKRTELFTWFKVLSQSIPLEPAEDLGMGFFTDYLPYKRGGHHFTSPEDTGVKLFNFALYPGEHQPSGHLNLSRARETDIEWKSSVINSSYEAEIIIVASAINFLLIGEGNAIMRYNS